MKYPDWESARLAMNNYMPGDVVELTYDNGFTEIGIIEQARHDAEELWLMLSGDYFIPLYMVSDHEIKYVTNDPRHPRVPDWARRRLV